MKICWDNLEGLRYSKRTGKWYKITKKGKTSNAYHYVEECETCKEPFLMFINNKGRFCDNKCSKKGKNNPFYGKKHSQKTIESFRKRIVTNETRKKMSKSAKEKNLTDLHKLNISKSMKKLRQDPLSIFNTKEYRKKLSVNNCMKNKDVVEKVIDSKRKNGTINHSEETKRKMSKAKSNRYTGKCIPLYNTYAQQIEWCEPVRRNQKDPNVLEIKCTWCGKWFVPILIMVKHRIQSIKGNYKGENRFYCSDGCKQNCPIYGKKPVTLMKEDAIRAGRLSWLELNREVQPQLRQMVFERDGWKCIKCKSTESLHCHHIEGIRWNPLESADVNGCITVCSDCHKEIHQKDGCKYNDMKCKEI